MKMMKEMDENRKMDELRRREEEEKRQKEREEDKAEIKSMAKEVTDGVKKEVMEAMKPWQERTVVLEENTAMVGEEVRRMAGELRELKEREGEKVRNLVGEVKELREKLESKQESRSYAATVEHSGRRPAVPALTGANSVPIGGGVRLEQEERQRIRGLFSHARKVIGLRPIERSHVDKVNKRLEEVEGESEKERQERAKMQAVKDFFKYEMRMRPDDMEKLEIVKIFPPAKDEWDVLYVELATMELAQFAMAFTAYMRRGTVGEDRVEVVKYVPRDIYTRFRAVNALGNQARIESGKSINFRVTFGMDDFILQHKQKGSKGWGPPLPLPADLPAVEHHLHLPRGTRSPGEAPGRPALAPTPEQARKRDREGSPTGSTPPTKKTDLENAVLVGSPTITPPRPGAGLLAAPAGLQGSITDIQASTPIATKTRSQKAQK